MLCGLVLSLCRRVQKAEPYRLTGAAAPLAIQSKEHGRQPGSLIAGFVKGANAAPFAVFPAPKVPASYQPVHKFAGPLLTGTNEAPMHVCLTCRGLQCCGFCNSVRSANAVSGVTFSNTPCSASNVYQPLHQRASAGDRGGGEGGIKYSCADTHHMLSILVSAA